MQKLFSSIVLIFLTLFQTPSQADQSAPRILILGDSLSAAYNIPVEQSWPSLFTTNIRAHYAQASVYNASISGETTHGGIQRLPELLDRIEPSHLIIELAGNDGLRGLKFSQTRKNLNNMVSLALKQNIAVLLIGVDLPPNLGSAYNQRFQQIFESVASRYPVKYLPHFLDGVAASDPGLMQTDGIHPTALAQPILAERILVNILDMLTSN
ncbi:MAG: arylesterase [Gammaproteobacteria bacterium]|nr:arylesterase [Gammaproteobacteria bacterium]